MHLADLITTPDHAPDSFAGPRASAHEASTEHVATFAAHVLEALRGGDSVLDTDGVLPHDPPAALLAVGIGAGPASTESPDAPAAALRHEAAEMADLVLDVLKPAFERTPNDDAPAEPEAPAHTAADVDVQGERADVADSRPAATPDRRATLPDGPAAPRTATAQATDGATEAHATKSEDRSGLNQPPPAHAAPEAIDRATAESVPADAHRSAPSRNDAPRSQTPHVAASLTETTAAPLVTETIEDSPTLEGASEDVARSGRTSVNPESVSEPHREAVRPEQPVVGEAARRQERAERTVAGGKAVRASVAAPGERSDSEAAKPAESEASSAPDASGEDFALPAEEFFEADVATTDPEPERNDASRTPADARIAQASTDAASDRTAPASRGGFVPRTVVTAAWLRAMMDQGLRVHAEPEGWSSVTMRLDDSDGTMTVRTRREDGAMAVHVVFSDPALRVLAAQQAERLEAVLAERYATTIDLSLSDTGGQTGERREARDDGRSSTGTVLSPDNDTRDVSRRMPWARNEWVV